MTGKYIDALEELAYYVFKDELMGKAYDKLKFQSQMIGCSTYLRSLPDDAKDDDTLDGTKVIGDLYTLFQVQPGLYDYVHKIFNKVLGLLSHSVRCEQYNSYLSNLLRAKTQRRMTTSNQVLNANIGFNINLFQLKEQLFFALLLFMWRHKSNNEMVKRFKSQTNDNNDDWGSTDEKNDSDSIDLSKYGPLHFMQMNYPLQTADSIQTAVCDQYNVTLSMDSDLENHTRKYKPRVSSKYFKSKLLTTNDSNNENANDNTNSNNNGNFNRFIVRPSSKPIKSKQQTYSNRIKFNKPLFRRAKSSKTKPQTSLSQPVQSNVDASINNNANTIDVNSGINNNDNDNEQEDSDIFNMDLNLDLGLDLPPLSFGSFDASNDGNNNGVGSQNSKASHITLEEGTVVGGLLSQPVTHAGLPLSQPDINVLSQPAIGGALPLSQSDAVGSLGVPPPPVSMPVVPSINPTIPGSGNMSGMFCLTVV